MIILGKYNWERKNEREQDIRGRESVGKRRSHVEAHLL